jgi:hypothetical protein
MGCMDQPELLPGQQRLGSGVGRHHQALMGGQVQAAELAQREQGYCRLVGTSGRLAGGR